MKSLLILAICGFLSSLSAKELEVVKEHSKIAFEIDYMVVTKVQGQFKDFTGTFNINEDKGEIYNIRVTASSKSIDTNDGKRDFHLRGSEFFYAANYPEILFESRGPFKIIPMKKFKLSGDLTIRGIKKPIEFEAIYKGKLKDPWSKESYFFDLTGTINRKAYGMVWNQSLDNGGVLVGETATINITIQGQASGSKTAFSTHMIPSTKGIIERDQLKKGIIKKLSTSTDPKDHENKEVKKINK